MDQMAAKDQWECEGSQDRMDNSAFRDHLVHQDHPDQSLELVQLEVSSDQ